MPRKPKKPCAYPGCPNLTDRRYCDEHESLMNKQYETYRRDPKTRKRYGRGWQRVRGRYIAKHPLCEECLKAGRSTIATEVHHIVPLSRGGTNDEKNLEAVCKPCHSRIHAKDKF